MKAAGVLEPSSKAKKLRSWLPEIETAFASGASASAVRMFLETAGMKYSSIAVFYSALAKARKAGSLLTLEQGTNIMGLSAPQPAETPVQPPVVTTPSALTSLPVTEKRTIGANGSTVLTSKHNGTTFIRIERKDELTNKQPRMEDFL